MLHLRAPPARSHDWRAYAWVAKSARCAPSSDLDLPVIRTETARGAGQRALTHPTRLRGRTYSPSCVDITCVGRSLGQPHRAGTPWMVGDRDRPLPWWDRCVVGSFRGGIVAEQSRTPRRGDLRCSRCRSVLSFSIPGAQPDRAPPAHASRTPDLPQDHPTSGLAAAPPPSTAVRRGRWRPSQLCRRRPEHSRPGPVNEDPARVRRTRTRGSRIPRPRPPTEQMDGGRPTPRALSPHVTLRAPERQPRIAGWWSPESRCGAGPVLWRGVMVRSEGGHPGRVHAPYRPALSSRFLCLQSVAPLSTQSRQAWSRTTGRLTEVRN
jgi:hypothetical protein